MSVENVKRALTSGSSSEWPDLSSGSFWTRIRRRLFGLNAEEIATRFRLFHEMQRAANAEMELDDADDELRIIQDYSDDQVDALRLELEPLDQAARWSRLQELFPDDDDAGRIWPLFRSER